MDHSKVYPDVQSPHKKNRKKAEKIEKTEKLTFWKNSSGTVLRHSANLQIPSLVEIRSDREKCLTRLMRSGHSHFFGMPRIFLSPVHKKSIACMLILWAGTLKNFAGTDRGEKFFGRFLDFMGSRRVVDLEKRPNTEFQPDPRWSNFTLDCSPRRRHLFQGKLEF